MCSLNMDEVRESIYNLLPPPEEVKLEKQPIYVSKFRPTVIHEKKLSKDPMRTMGPAKVDVPSPEQFLKKRSKEPKLPEVKKEGRINPLKKPPVPTRAEMPPLEVQTKRHFKRAVTLAPQRKPQPISVDTNKGHKEALENSGLVPKYIKKKAYGAVPVYLRHRVEEKHRAQEAYDNYVKEKEEQETMQELSEEKRLSIVEGLKTNWNNLNHEYQSLSLVIDTCAKKARKQRLEAAMKQLENDIEFFNRYKVIYVNNN